MVYLADTNVLLRLVDRASPVHFLVRTGVRKLRSAGHEIYMAPQNVVEFWNVATRPAANNGFGMPPAVADRLLIILERRLPLLPDSPAVHSQWRKLVVTYGVIGVQTHDARLVANMLVNGISHILTFNTADFARFAPLGIVAVDPATV